MQTLNRIPDWDYFSENLRNKLGYYDATLERTKSTYNDFVRNYCALEGGDAETAIIQGISKAGNAYEENEISKDKLVRIRRLAFRMLQLINDGEISWKRTPLYGRRFGSDSNETLLTAFTEAERNNHKHAESIIKRDENIIRQFILYSERNGIDIVAVTVTDIIAFLSYMKTRRPAGIKSTASALKHFYQYCVERGLVNPEIIRAIKPWDTPHKRIYGVLSAKEKTDLIHAMDSDTEIGKRDKAIFMLAMDCGLRSSDICNLTLNEIDWRTASVNIVQKKTGNPLAVPFSTETGNALADYILNAREYSALPYVFLKKTYCDSAMTSALLCQRMKKLVEKAGIHHPASDKISMHTFRRSLGSEMIDSGESLEMVAQVLGHRDREATKGYISISERMLRKCPLDMPQLNKAEVNHDPNEV